LFASWAIEREFSPKRVQALIGHSSIQMTFDLYGHLFSSLEDDHAKFARRRARAGLSTIGNNGTHEKAPYRQCVTRQLCLSSTNIFCNKGTTIALSSASETMPATDASEIGEI